MQNIFTPVIGIALYLTATLGIAAEQDPAMKSVISRMRPYVGEHHAGVTTTTLYNKVMCGYQGWFATPNDGAKIGWTHYSAGSKFAPGACTFDLWPDMSEMDPDEKAATPFKHANDQTAYLFSPYNTKTVLRHFKWMQDYGLDGVFLQRFGASLKSAPHLNQRNRVLANVQAGANRYGRAWAVMYDLSGLSAGDIQTYVMEDWKRLVDKMAIRKDKAYLWHNGKPVVAVWGVGFNDNRKYTLAECRELIEFLKNDPHYGGNTVMLGVPTHWRTLTGDAVNDQSLHGVIKQADIVSPWMVGRYGDAAGAQRHVKKNMTDDIVWCREQGKDYLPVIFPGFSWQNLKRARGEKAALDQIPRHGGQFLWSQATAYKQAGADAFYVAMFDEIDEGTAIFKCSNNPPVGESKFVTYEGLPTDHYLWLTGQIGRMLCNELPDTAALPVRER